jgi:hypothetical protein
MKGWGMTTEYNMDAHNAISDNISISQYWSMIIEIKKGF